MQIDLNKLPEQIPISRDMAVNTFILMQNLKSLLPHLVAACALPPGLVRQVPATIGLICAWESIAQNAVDELTRQEATDIFRSVGIKL
jgi:hypothetical protein